MKIIKKNKLLFLFLLLLIFLIGASFISAQKPLEIVYPQIPGALTPITTKTSLPDYIRYIFQFSIFLGASIAFGSLIYGGVRYLTSAGSPSPQKDAKSQMSAGILGLIILVSAYLILNTINPQLVAFKVSLPEKAPTSRPSAFTLKPGVAELVEIPVGGLIENLWGEKTATYPKGDKSAKCYKFDDNGNATTSLPASYDRLDCIKWFSESVQIKAKNLNEPVKELQKLYTCYNCCENCCQNACSNNWVVCADVCDQGGVPPSWQWENCGGHTCCAGTQKPGCWEGCGGYECCEGAGMDTSKYYCKTACCEYFQGCTCDKCSGNICRNPTTKEPCNLSNPALPYEDPLVAGLIDKIDPDPYPNMSAIKPALKELQIKMGLFPLVEAMTTNQNICCPGSTCPPDSKIGILDCLISNSDTKTLIKNLLIYKKPAYSQIDEEKLKEILGIKSVMKYLIEEYQNLLLGDDNLAKTMMINLGLLENEAAINEIAWMGTQANASDEWIELYNNTEGDINFNNEWKLIVRGKFEIDLSGTIPAQGFYLLENEEGATSEVANQIYIGSLADTGEALELYDQFGNLVDKVNCSNRWFAGDKDSRTSMERINPQEDGSDIDNWATNLGKDSAGNPIYGTPKNPNSVGLNIVSYPSLDALKGKVGERLNEESQREKLILVLRQKENLERMLKSDSTKATLVNILVGENERFKKLLSQGDVIRILLEDKEKSDLLFSDEHTKKVIKATLIDREWKSEEEENTEWLEFINKLPEARTNFKLINDFQEDLLWVSEAGDLMWKCDVDPMSYDQLRVPELFGPKRVEEVPEWTGIKKEIPQLEEGLDPSVFYCQKLLW